MAVYAIGDIQGCDQEFGQLLTRLNFSPSRDTLWLVGDLVNRGPRSLDVLRRVKAMGSAAITVLGNHDLHLLALTLSPNERIKSKDTLQEVLAAPDREELMHWLRHRPMLHHDAALGYTMVHAGLPPQWDLATAQACARELEETLRDDTACRQLFAHMYGDKPDRWSEDLRGVDRLRFITNCLTRLRYCRADGQLDLKFKGEIGEAPAGLMPWFRVPERRSRSARIVCGHWSALGYHDSDGVLAIDTGCVWGEKLCAVRLDQPAEPVFMPCSSSGLSVGSE
ncbi:symmetrical bis(5'-nucleosyl)-tetraphosphatase [Steroidobacter sp. S1-65]|uniref:Bis(5'-nucleosyl)-tetraphosphatase, symmetrical n=1 Tax=Steroidobacter gossypii TaxID=2805490 RepID=A0ABS1X5F8_9GAMM|nr:symmetrical bis(5'-nucleosyl)-tetraphosphatase [Steroidobacter gossypii]MBM0108464.1 symmetrical bis(5'-nucleosyl)-tetraphosphatase [Steroidobacter gossypii]